LPVNNNIRYIFLPLVFLLCRVLITLSGTLNFKVFTKRLDVIINISKVLSEV